MKKLTIILVLAQVCFNACQKENTSTPGTIVCPPAPTPKSKEQMLTERTWKADEIRIQLSNNTTTYYKRGVSGNTYDSDSLKFGINNTGFYYYSGSAFNTTWNFTDTGKTKMIIVINQPPTPITINLENVTLTETSFRYAQYFTGAVSYLAAGSRVPN